jgi:cytochrome c-type biogenesis protein
MEDSGQASILIAFWAGFISFHSPCVLPLFPSYLSFVSGVSIEDFENSAKNRKLVILNSICFITGFSLVFISLGASFSFLGSFLFSYQNILKKVGGFLIIFFGLYITGLLKINILMQYKQMQIKEKPVGYLGSVLVGASFGLGWTPCVGPILGSILILASASENMTTGMIMLLAYSTGMAIPFFGGSLAINVFFKYFKAFRKYLNVVHITSGIILIIVGLLLVTDYITVLNSYAASLTPKWLWKFL